ncbi:MAG: integrase [Candidatus Muproteobacteria bacterium RIFCSPHIGHO2_01_FULL_61_200]|nr:MAG: integrase [Candidatus Muproteobacteria bacterium RIFCSPHIGHO2_01_FULL_61_200]
MTRAERFARVERDEPALPVTRQCELLALPRSSAYYERGPAVSDEDLRLMRLLDELHLKYPFMGSRRLRDELKKLGVIANRKRVQRLMRLMGLEALYPRKRTSVPNKAHRVFPYLLRDLLIDRPNQVWATDITYIPMQRGFLYLVAIIDWASRAVLSWRLSTTMEVDFCVEALEEAIARYGVPEIFNTDQGAQFTSEAFLGVLERNQIRISMDGKGRWRDNVFVERLWRSVKYEEVYLKAYETVHEARSSLAKYFDFYNHERGHQSLNRQTPWLVYTARTFAEAA